MPGDGELTGPIGYSGWWPVLAIAAVLLVVAYYSGVAWWARRRPAVGDGDVRREHLDRLDRIEADLGSGRISARAAHQRLSATVRSYVGEVSELPAPTLTLADLRRSGPPQLAEAIELMYPPEFAPGEQGRADERFGEALRRSRELVSSWT